MKKLSNTECIVLAREDILNCEENIVKPHGPAFIKLFHHFTYVSSGVVDCKYVKGVGHFNRHQMNQIGIYFLTISLLFILLQFAYLLTLFRVFWGLKWLGSVSALEFCGICGDPEDAENDGGRTWLECEICKQWFHCDCLHIDNDIIQDKYDFMFKCDNCIWN
jgi:hypothetical protein